ncbi:UPF0687 protein C20orf27 homolog [Mytilus californianus]|uniref:UPF0687 protein C20orf27 homolog n=1 Tax=Mytilus californianus TaxID=6549 RepID=UPI002246C721|nr:UPF0687 protein C20orf27 homolog [Mytilus californianus]
METISENSTTSDGGHEGHVHFAPEQVESHNMEIQVKNINDDTIDIHLGFLKVHHYYEVSFCVHDKLGEDVETDPLQNVHVTVQQITPTEAGNGHSLMLHFYAHKEKLLKEILFLKSCSDPEKTVKLILHARVLGRGKGTPALKNGIKCFKVDPEYDSDAMSDWQGF